MKDITIHDIHDIRDRLAEDLRAARKGGGDYGEIRPAERRLETIETLLAMFKRHDLQQGWGPRRSRLFGVAEYAGAAAALVAAVFAWALLASSPVSKIPDRKHAPAAVVAPIRSAEHGPATLPAGQSPLSF